MSYLAIPASKTEYGVVEVGGNINVLDGIISLSQDLSPNANVVFNNINANSANISGNLYAAGNLVITSITPNAGNGISLSNVVTNGYSASFTVTNTGVLNANAGTGVSVNANTGNVTFTNTGVISTIAGNGIAVSGPNGNVTVTNTGVTNLNAGSGISLSGNTGNITISSFGADLINVVGVTANYTATLTDEYIGVFSANAVTVTLPTAVAGRVYTIKDEYGQGSGKITLQPQTGMNIDGKINYIISVPNQSISVVQRAGNWWII